MAGDGQGHGVCTEATSDDLNGLPHGDYQATSVLHRFRTKVVLDLRVGEKREMALYSYTCGFLFHPSVDI